VVIKRPYARPTIKDVARVAGVSISTASYALNGRYGASAATRERVVAAAAQLGWWPDSSARRLASSRSESVGLVLPVRTAASFGEAPWFMEFISGVDAALGERSYGLLLQAVRDSDQELAIYRSWARSRRVDGAVLVDVVSGDPRPGLAAFLGLPVVVAGPPEFAAGFSCVWTDDGSAVRDAVDHLAQLGHHRLARVAGPSHLAHSIVRGRAFQETCAELGLELTTVVSDFSSAGAQAATRDLLASNPRPTAVICDDDLGAVVALGVAQEVGVAVPAELSILAWDDSILCRSTHPQLSAMSHDVRSYGAHIAERLLEAIGGARPVVQLEAPPRLVVRGTTGPPS